jgi:DNA-binding CsgD family transcriptional regulator
MPRHRQRNPLQVSERHIRNELGLTRAEAKLAYRLARGMTLREATDAADIAYETGRTLLQSVFRKAGVHRQAALLLLIAQLAAGAAATR